MRSLLSRLLRRHRAPGPLLFRLASVPADTPAGAPIYLTGAGNGWTTDHPDYAFTPPDPATGCRWLALPDTWRGPLEFKLCRGSWDTIEAGAAGEPLPNRRLRRPRFAATQADRAEISLQVLSWQDEGQLPSTRSHSASASVRVLALAFAMPQLGGRTRRVWLYAPPDYDRYPARHYPVLYVQDGQNVFDQVTSFSGEWGLDETLDALHQADPARGNCLVVAVDNSGPHRLDEYSAWPNARARDGRRVGGQGAQYVSFLADTLKPYIDQHFRTLPDAAHTGILGSSMGGLLALYAGLARPDVFGRVGVFSPALWFAQAELPAFLARHPPHPDARFYFVSGALEYASLAPLMQTTAAALLAAGLPAAQLVCEVRPGGQHAEWFWGQEFGAAYEWLFLGD